MLSLSLFGSWWPLGCFCNLLCVPLSNALSGILSVGVQSICRYVVVVGWVCVFLNLTQICISEQTHTHIYIAGITKKLRDTQQQSSSHNHTPNSKTPFYTLHKTVDSVSQQRHPWIWQQRIARWLDIARSCIVEPVGKLRLISSSFVVHIL